MLLIAGANAANLFLVRAEARRREIAVRLALGAGRGRIAGTFIAESLVLAFAGGTMGAWLAAGGIRLLVAYGPATLPRLHEVSIDGTVVLFAALLCVLAGLVLGARPQDVRRMVLWQGLSVTMVGVCLGLAVAAAATRLMTSLLFEVSALDPLTFTAVALGLTAVSTVATYLPARKASRIDPAQALREEG